MLTILNNTDIEYTQNDTFELNVTSEDAFDEGMVLNLIISKNENGSPLIENNYFLNSDGAFDVTLSEENKSKLQLGDYIYKLILKTSTGIITTQKSGFFIVKWGV